MDKVFTDTMTEASLLEAINNVLGEQLFPNSYLSKQTQTEAFNKNVTLTLDKMMETFKIAVENAKPRIIKLKMNAIVYEGFKISVLYSKTSDIVISEFDPFNNNEVLKMSIEEYKYGHHGCIGFLSSIPIILDVGIKDNHIMIAEMSDGTISKIPC
jgi:hypothetical protein